MNAVRLTTDHLARILATDEAAGDSLQTSPLAWQQRRELLGHISALEEDAHNTYQLTLQLSTLLEPVSGGSTSLADIVTRLRVSQQLYAEVRAALAAEKAAAAQQPATGHCPHGYPVADLNDGTATCDGCNV